MNRFATPILVVSQCLTPDICRYDARASTNRFVTTLRPYVTLQAVCPEIGIGLGVPRGRINLIRSNGEYRVYQPSHGRDLTTPLQDFSKTYLSTLGEVDGFILKSKSPSCGIGTTEVFDSPHASEPSSRDGTGLFAREVLKRFGHVAIADEHIVQDHAVRHHWLTRLFVHAKFRTLRDSRDYEGIQRFHEHHRLLFSAHDQTLPGRLDSILGSLVPESFDSGVSAYGDILTAALKQPARVAIVHDILDTFLSENTQALTRQADTAVSTEYERFRDGVSPLSALLQTMHAFREQFRNPDQLNQSFFLPYPGALMVDRL